MPTEVGWGRHYHFPRAIVHVDGDSFFAACEVAKNPALKGKPVVTGKERGIVSAATYEAKARGVTRGVSLHEARRICPELIVIDSDYETYGLYSRRMYAIMRRYTPIVEEYGIDECFGELTGLKRKFKMSYEEIAQALQADLTRELNITFGVGLAPNKVLAKVGSKYRKPNGFTSIPLTEREHYLADTAIDKIWGIGPNTARFLHTHGVRTALDFAHKKDAWVKETVTAPIYDIWKELNGECVMELVTETKESYQSIQRTRTFRPSTKDPEFLMAQLSKNIEGACAKARSYELSATHVSFFLKSQSFRYRVCELKLTRPTNLPSDILPNIIANIGKMLQPGELYRTTGITLSGLTGAPGVQPDLFSDPAKIAGKARVFEKVDELDGRYGRHTVYLASSMRAIAEERRDEEHHHEYGTSASAAKNAPQRFKGRDMKKLFSMPYLGEVG